MGCLAVVIKGHIYSSFGAECWRPKITSIRAPPSMLSPATILPSYCSVISRATASPTPCPGRKVSTR
ncbi:hypothetical protein ECEPECA14_4970 [Escherichia coli EPECa14]|nr:hypothetical protein ECEPECA14_4970 [Escherichia coli EPECa14]